MTNPTIVAIDFGTERSTCSTWKDKRTYPLVPTESLRENEPHEASRKTSTSLVLKVSVLIIDNCFACFCQ